MLVNSLIHEHVQKNDIICRLALNLHTFMPVLQFLEYALEFSLSVL